jgi:CRISPR-associated endonuclease Cas1
LFESEIGEVVLKSGNCVSTGVLSALGFWGIDVVIATRNGRPIAMLKNLEDDSHVETRICQYEALKNGKGIAVAKQVVISKVESQNIVLKKYGLRQHDIIGINERIRAVEFNDDLRKFRNRLLGIEGRCGNKYFEQIFQLFPIELRTEKRRTFQAYDAVNNLFNLSYQLLFWKCYRALTKAHLETHLGFLHSLIRARPSLVCDFIEFFSPHHNVGKE